MRTQYLLPALALAAPLAAQTPDTVTAADYARAEQFLGQNATPLVTGLVSPPTWLDDGRFWYRVQTPNGWEFFIVDVAKRTRTAAFDQPRLARAIGALTRATVPPYQLPFERFDLSKDSRQLNVVAGTRRLQCDLQAYTCTPLDTIPSARQEPPHSIVSPDGTRAAFIRDHNLWVKDLRTGAGTQLTTEGVEDYGYATNNAGWIRSDEPVLSWSPDARTIATFQHDQRGTAMMYLASTNVGAPELEAWHYPLPGDSVIFRIRRVFVDVESQRVIPFQMPVDQHRSTICDHISCNGDYTDTEWLPDGSALAFVSVSRDHKQATFRIADATTGAVRTVMQETSPTQFESGIAPVGTVNWRVLPETNELLWWSQRDDWGHLYLYDLQSGALKRQITKGAWNIADVEKVTKDDIYVTGAGLESGRDPYFVHFYKVSKNKGKVTLLTPENATHSVNLAPDASYFVDTYSTPATPPITVVRDMSGGRLMTLERGDVSRLVAQGWQPPAPIVVKARDGKTDLYGLMYTPSQMDSTKQYPIINYIYPGPQTGSVRGRNFVAARGDNQALAELGFVVVEIDGMGTPWRSKSFQDAYYGKMIDNTIPDQVTGMQQLAQRYRFIDIERAGIWGHSGGGFATAAAMFTYPDFFEVGISESGNHDNRNYEDDWGERYQGLMNTPADSAAYAAQATQAVAKNLKGKLLLAHGGMDDNVPPYNTYLVVDALIRANKDFDLLILPNARHGYGEQSDYMMRRRWDYFVEHLMGAPPPAR
ncbi:MAG: DPP IV N-terminal domain-containing protein [Gemmatimonadota bacterium]